MSVDGTAAAPPPAPPTRSVGDIVSDVMSDVSTLVRQEIDLATTELKQEAGRLGKGAGMLGGAGVAALMVLFFASLALTYLLDNWLPIELAALIVALVWAVVTAVLALIGRKEIQAANPQLPTTQKTLQEDVQWAKNQ